MEKRGRRVVGSLFLALTFWACGAPLETEDPGFDDVEQVQAELVPAETRLEYWGPIQVPSGDAFGQMTSNRRELYAHVSGYVTDKSAGDDCTYVKVTWKSYAGVVRDIGRKKACGGRSVRFDFAKTVHKEFPYVQIFVCQQRTLRGDTCRGITRWLQYVR